MATYDVLCMTEGRHAKADLLHVKLALGISFPAGKVILISLQLLPLLLHASLGLLILLLHPLKHLRIRNFYLVITLRVRKKEKTRQEKRREENSVLLSVLMGAFIIAKAGWWKQ